MKITGQAALKHVPLRDTARQLGELMQSGELVSLECWNDPKDAYEDPHFIVADDMLDWQCHWPVWLMRWRSSVRIGKPYIIVGQDVGKMLATYQSSVKDTDILWASLRNTDGLDRHAVIRTLVRVLSESSYTLRAAKLRRIDAHINISDCVDKAADWLARQRLDARRLMDMAANVEYMDAMIADTIIDACKAKEMQTAQPAS